MISVSSWLHPFIKVISIGGLLCVCPGVQADPVPSRVTLPTKIIAVTVKTKSMSEIITLLSRQIERGILIDDKPEVPAIDLEVRGTPAEILDKIADAFDYTWRVNKSGIILMQKRFKASSSLPQMNLLEMQEMAAEAVAALTTLHCDPTPYRWAGAMQSLFDSLSEKQQTSLREKQSIPSIELTDTQRNLIQQIILNHRFSSAIVDWNYLLNELQGMPKSTLEVRILPATVSQPTDPASSPTASLTSPIDFCYVFHDKEGHEQVVLLKRKMPEIRQKGAK